MKSLPEKFSQLQPFVERWALSTQNERQIARRTASREQLTEFYEVMLPLMPEILKAANEFELGGLPKDHRTLFELACSLAEVAPHVELYRGSPLVPNAFEEARMDAAHGALPTWKG